MHILGRKLVFRNETSHYLPTTQSQHFTHISHVKFDTCLWGLCCYHVYFPDEETEAQGGCTTCLWVVGGTWDPENLELRYLPLTLCNAASKNCMLQFTI